MVVQRCSVTMTKLPQRPQPQGVPAAALLRARGRTKAQTGRPATPQNVEAAARQQQPEGGDVHAVVIALGSKGKGKKGTALGRPASVRKEGTVQPQHTGSVSHQLWEAHPLPCWTAVTADLAPQSKPADTAEVETGCKREMVMWRLEQSSGRAERQKKKKREESGVKHALIRYTSRWNGYHLHSDSTACCTGPPSRGRQHLLCERLGWSWPQEGACRGGVTSTLLPRATSASPRESRPLGRDRRSWGVGKKKKQKQKKQKKRGADQPHYSAWMAATRVCSPLSAMDGVVHFDPHLD